MFLAIRDYFAKSDTVTPRRGRGRRAAKLFLFEFVVVVLGVLSAQLLQDWFQKRLEARRAAEAVRGLDAETQSFVNVAEYRLRAHRCETDRIARLVAAIRRGENARPEDLAPPIMPMPVITAWSDETRSAVARRSGAEALRRYDALQLLGTMVAARQRDLEDQWAEFRLLHEDFGPPSADSRATLLVAAARAGGLLSAIDMNAAYVKAYAPAAKADEASLKRLAAMDHPCAAAALIPAAKAEPQ